MNPLEKMIESKIDALRHQQAVIDGQIEAYATMLDYINNPSIDLAEKRVVNNMAQIISNLERGN